MPLLEPENFYHIYNRGINKQKIFHQDQDYILFLSKVNKVFTPSVNILSWCLMPNHFHFLVYVIENENLKKFNFNLGNMLSSYAQVFNLKYNRTGSLFQQRTKLKLLDNNDQYYPLVCFNYIHQNPLKAGLVAKMEEYVYSSFKDYIGLRNGVLCNKSLARHLLALPENENAFREISYSLIPELKSKNIF